MRIHEKISPSAGIEPASPSFRGRCFTIKLRRTKSIHCIFIYLSTYQSSNLRLSTKTTISWRRPNGYFFHEIYTHLKPPKCPDMTLHKKLNSGIIRRGIINNLFTLELVIIIIFPVITHWKVRNMSILIVFFVW